MSDLYLNILVLWRYVSLVEDLFIVGVFICTGRVIKSNEYQETRFKRRNNISRRTLNGRINLIKSGKFVF